MSGIFGGVIQFDKEGNISINRWVEWWHFMVPNKDDFFRKIIRHVLAIFKHCLCCTALDGCYLVSSNCPESKIHPNCDCKQLGVDFEKVSKNAEAFLPISKLDKYVYSEKYFDNGKRHIFESIGFDKDSLYSLKTLFEKQAKENYLGGRYVLKKLDKYGQRITITVEIKGRKIKSGWMLCPEGKIRNITPFGGWAK